MARNYPEPFVPTNFSCRVTKATTTVTTVDRRTGYRRRNLRTGGTSTAEPTASSTRSASRGPDWPSPGRSASSAAMPAVSRST